MSQPSTRSASPAAMRTAWMSAGLFATRTCVVTAPPFWARPVWSSTLAPLCSRCAAMPSSAPMVTTPVPPTPVIRMFQGWSRLLRNCGSGRFTSRSLLPVPLRLRRPPPLMVTKLGQKPFTQLKSLLQLDWSISRLRPYSVSLGSTATQFDFTPQSPQPSQTSELIAVRLAGSGILPRLRRRRFSAAQVWSKISTEVPATSRRRFCCASSSLRS